MAKMKQRWAYGIFLGVSRKSGEIWTALENGEVRKARAVRRIPVEERWGKDCRRWVKHVPWNRYKGMNIKMVKYRKGWCRKSWKKKKKRRVG